MSTFSQHRRRGALQPAFFCPDAILGKCSSSNQLRLGASSLRLCSANSKDFRGVRRFSARKSREWHEWRRPIRV